MQEWTTGSDNQTMLCKSRPKIRVTSNKPVYNFDKNDFQTFTWILCIVDRTVWKQTAQEQSKWRGLINKGAALYEEMRICEAGRKRTERKAKTNGPPADLSPPVILYY